MFRKTTTQALDIQLNRDTVKDLGFLEEMAGPEGIWADKESMKRFVTDCSGMTRRAARAAKAVGRL